MALDEHDIRLFLNLRSRLQGLFPGLFVRIRDRAQAELAGLGATGVVGEFDREKAMALFPELGLQVPVDWVAFGFPGHAFYDVHVGVIVETSDWPLRCHVGLHVSEQAWPGLQALVSAIDWTGVGPRPEHSVAGSVREQRFGDAARPLDLSAPDLEADRLAERAVAYYRAVFDSISGERRA